MKNTIYNTEAIDYKNIYLLRKFITVQGKIIPRRLTNLTSKQHRFITKAVRTTKHYKTLIHQNSQHKLF